MEIIKKIISVQDEKNVRELATSALMQEIWLNLCKHVNIKNEDNYSYVSASTQARLQLMMQYIQQNYRSNISLDNIADYAMLSKSTVLNYFRKYLHTTPINYLINYRLNEAAVLLRKTEKKIITVSNETGFNNVDYFCKLFKKHYHLTPTEYRKK
ncbi:L-rhamnose operon regulatory protein rhaS [uncultured Clostridium sp.]|uniref:AraC family transcriptional regulator n=1 Tax=Muricoprocola aceti TaxID=2981772 RepID=A0ABT2SJI4_9FIRM|nr:AraC family transcriptional regulator [Muricoprocola aceti]MCU6724669.1 AraC family transcriptional regulator [Muricoprocola aceti]SCH21597.1 L-rhamnose operon regulatory protein rhaS [uncultured Clostridium sp.]